MSEEGLIVLDGSTIRTTDISLPKDTFTKSQLLDFAQSKVSSSSLFGLSLPHHLKSSLIQRLRIVDDQCFRTAELDGDGAATLLRDYVNAIADELKEDPLVVAVLDGKTMKLFLDDEDDFAMLAENIFTELDTEDKGKINKSEIRNALIHLGVEFGVPPDSELPVLNDIVERHTSAEKEEELGQAQFAELLQHVLQELAEVLANKPIAVIQNIKLVNGSKVKKLLASEEKLAAITEKVMHSKKDSDGEWSSTDTIRIFLEENYKDLGLPSPNADESVVFLYDEVFADVDESENDTGLLLKDILNKFAEKLEASPVFQDFTA